MSVKVSFLKSYIHTHRVEHSNRSRGEHMHAPTHARYTKRRSDYCIHVSGMPRSCSWQVCVCVCVCAVIHKYCVAMCMCLCVYYGKRGVYVYVLCAENYSNLR